MKGSEIARHIDAKLIGGDLPVQQLIGFDGDNQQEDAIMWLSDKNQKNFNPAMKGTVIVSRQFNSEQPLNSGLSLLVVEAPRKAFQALVNLMYPDEVEAGVAKSAIVDASVKMGHNVYIGEHVVIEANVSIGNNVVILHNTVIKRETQIGDDCKIGSNCTIGGVGFGYEKDENGDFVVIKHIGNVVLHRAVEIGNNTCIDRAVLGSTVLHENVKVDNLVHIAHGVQVGRNSLVIANAMIAGSTVIGENVWIAPSAAVINKKSVGDNAVVGMGAVVVRNVKEGSVVAGNPAQKIN